MEERKIYLEPDDEITDVIDKIKKTDRPIVVLIIPESATILQSVVNLKLLKKQADKLEKRLAVVTDSQKGRQLAEQVGISVYKKARADKIEEEEKEKQSADEVKSRFPLSLKKDKKKAKDKKRPKKKEKKEKPAKASSQGKARSWLFYLVGILIIAILIVGSALAYRYLPRAEVIIKLSPKQEKKTVELMGTKVSSSKTDQFYVKPVTVSASNSGEYDASGKKQVGGRTSGQITIYNYWSSDNQPLVVNTRFVHDSTNKLFRTTQAVTVPGTQVVEGETVPGTVNVNIKADELGSSYNVGTGQFRIPGLPAAKQAKIYGQTDSGLTGGYEKEILVVSQNDYDQAKEDLSKKLNSQLNKKISAQVNGMKFFKQKKEKITKDSASPDIGEEAGSFKLEITKQVKTFAYSQDNFLQAVRGEFNDQLTDDRELAEESLEDKIEIKKIEHNFEDNQVELRVKVEGTTIPKLDQNIIRENLIGKNKLSGEKYLIGFSQIGDAQINLWPFWVKQVPDETNKIKIELKYEQ